MSERRLEKESLTKVNKTNKWSETNSKMIIKLLETDVENDS